QRAPYEVWRRTRSFGRFFWSWIRGRDPEPRAHDEVVRLVRRREFGAVNISTLLSLAVLGGPLLVAPLECGAALGIKPRATDSHCWPNRSAVAHQVHFSPKANTGR